MEEKPLTRRRWFQFSLRIILVLVTLVAVGLTGSMQTSIWLAGRKQEFEALATKHRFMFARNANIVDWMRVQHKGALAPSEIEYTERAESLMEYHRKLCEKYHYAYEYPWFPVAPDPPEPESPATQD